VQLANEIDKTFLAFQASAIALEGVVGAHLPAFVTRSMEDKWPMIDDGFPLQTIQEVA
jgi:hypothetical protein